MSLPRRRFLHLAVSAVFPIGSRIAVAQTYPAQTVTFVVSFAAGGVADVVARLVAQKLGDRGAGKFVVENRGGAGGNLAARLVSSAAADGYVVLATTTALAINATASRNKGYASEDLRAVAVVALASDVMAVHPAATPRRCRSLSGTPVTKGLPSAPPAGTGSIAEPIPIRRSPRTTRLHVPSPGGAAGQLQRRHWNHAS